MANHVVPHANVQNTMAKRSSPSLDATVFADALCWALILSPGSALRIW
jgi:hypothetical protein